MPSRRHIPRLALFAFSFIALSTPALAFEVKGLSPGMKLDAAQKLMPQLQCKHWIAGPYAQMCDAGNLEGNLSTLADQPLVSIRVIADGNDVVHSLSWSVSCGIQTPQLAAAFQAKWGTPEQNTFDKMNDRFRWLSKNGEVMEVWKANGKDNTCHVVDVRDAIAIKWLETKPIVPSKDL